MFTQRAHHGPLQQPSAESEREEQVRITQRIMGPLATQPGKVKQRQDGNGLQQRRAKAQTPIHFSQTVSRLVGTNLQQLN